MKHTNLSLNVCSFISSCTWYHARVTETSPQQRCHDKDKYETIGHRDCWRHIHCQIRTAESVQANSLSMQQTICLKTIQYLGLQRVARNSTRLNYLSISWQMFEILNETLHVY